MHGELLTSTYTVISGLLYDVDNSKQQNFELCHCFSKQAKYQFSDNMANEENCLKSQEKLKF